MEILANNLLVFFVYVGAGLLVKHLTGSKLAPYAPWAIFCLHLCLVVFRLQAYIHHDGVLFCLRGILPHGLFEIPGLILGCTTGTQLSMGRKNTPCLLMGAALIAAGAWLETSLSPLFFVMG